MKKNRFRMLLGAVLAVSMTVSMAACGGKTPPPDTGSKSEAEKPAASSSVPEKESALAGIKLQTVDVGDFLVGVPEGWLAVPTELDGEIQKNTIRIYKGAKTKEDTAGLPSVQIIYNAQGRSVNIEGDKKMYQSAKDSPADRLKLMTNYEWKGFRGDKELYEAECLYAILPGSKDKGAFRVNMWISRSGKPLYSIDDDDVVAMLNSLKPKQ